jgi:hypothetical protein
MTRITGTLCEDLYTLMTISRSIVVRMRNVSDKVAEKIKTQFLLHNFFSENRAVYEIMWKNILPYRPQMTWHMRIARWIPNATTHTRSRSVFFKNFSLSLFILIYGHFCITCVTV